MESRLVGRFAPSPSGRMHLGNAWCALLAWLSVRSRGGKMVLRIEDLDTARCKREYAAQLIDDLHWLGLDWDEGPGESGPQPPYYQSECGALYAGALQKIGETARLYPCFCSRVELHAASAPHRSDRSGECAGGCRSLSDAEAAEKALVRSPCLRVEVPDLTVEWEDLSFGVQQQNLLDGGDFILRRSDGVYAYQLAVTVDDARMGITEVVRGCDLLDSTPRQRWLFSLLGAEPPEYRHLPLLTAPDGRRLSKRDGDLDLGALRARFSSGEPVIGALAYLAALRDSPAPIPARDLIGGFRWDGVGQQNIPVPPSFFSCQKNIHLF